MPLLMCPNCNASMNEVKRNDVAFDMCPTCRGVWLDRGELEKIISAVQAERADIDAERARFAGQPPTQQHQQPYQPQRPPQQGYGERGEYGGRGEYGERGEYGHGRKRRRGFDLFDIFD